MQNLFIKPTEDTPKIELNIDENIFRIVGKSLPENASDFYISVTDWLTEYNKNPRNKSLVFDFRIDYFNTSSAKEITKILLLLQEINKQAKVKIRWFYFKEDIDLKKSGELFNRLIKLDFEIIPYNEGEAQY